MDHSEYEIVIKNGIPRVVEVATGRTVLMPRIAGADGEDETVETDRDTSRDADTDRDTNTDTDSDRDRSDEDDDSSFDERAQLALRRSRNERRKVESEARTLRRQLEELQRRNETEAERSRREAEEARERSSNATDKLRRANLLVALHEEGISGTSARAAARLLDGLEWSDSDEPTNLTDALEAAKLEFGASIFGSDKGVTPAKTRKTDAGSGRQDREGPTLTADELAAARAAKMTSEEYAHYKSSSVAVPDPAQK